MSAETFNKLRRSIARERGLKINDPIVQRLALLQTRHDRLATRIISGSGAAVATSELLAIEAAMNAVPIGFKHQLKIHFVTGQEVACSRCGKLIETGHVEDATGRPASADAPPAAVATPASPPSTTSTKEFEPAHDFHDGAPRARDRRQAIAVATAASASRERPAVRTGACKVAMIPAFGGKADMTRT
jgi:hypothetical protein